MRGKRQALDPAVDERGNTAVHRDGSGTLRARGITKERPTPDTFERLFVPHAATCPGRQPGPGYPPGPLRQPVPATLPDNVIPFDRARRRRATRRP